MYRALWSVNIAVIVTFVVSLCSKPKPVTELDGLVYGATKLPAEPPASFWKSDGSGR